VHYVERADDLEEMARQVYEATRNTVLVEAYLPGREYCIAVCGSVIARSGKLEQLPGPFCFAGVERVLAREERVFTSMDVEPITNGRVRALEPVGDAVVLSSLEEIASRLFTEMRLKTLVRLDVRADALGKLFVLEANPKPDLKAADGSGTSLIVAGLQSYGMNYDDLILSIFANRISDLWAECHGSAEQFFERFPD
jgi:D-alanine-D-alanine ligase